MIEELWKEQSLVLALNHGGIPEMTLPNQEKINTELLITLELRANGIKKISY